MLLKIFKITILSAVLISCATPKEKELRPMTRRERQLLYYQRLRAAQWEEITKKRKSERYHRDKKVSVRPKRKQKKKIKKSQVIPVDPHGQRIEIEQLLSFHCIKKRMDNCDELSTRIFDKCLQEYNPGDRRLTDCVKRSLR